MLSFRALAATRNQLVSLERDHLLGAFASVNSLNWRVLQRKTGPVKSCSTCCEPLPSWVSEMKSTSTIKAFSDMERINHTRSRPTFYKTQPQPDTDRDITIRTPVLAFHPDYIFSKTSSILFCFSKKLYWCFSDFLVALKSQLNVPLRVFLL